MRGDYRGKGRLDSTGVQQNHQTWGCMAGRTEGNAGAVLEVLIWQKCRSPQWPALWKAKAGVSHCEGQQHTVQ